MALRFLPARGKRCPSLSLPLVSLCNFDRMDEVEETILIGTVSDVVIVI